MILAGCAGALAAATAGVAWLGDLADSPRSFVLLFGLAGAAYGLAAVLVVRRPPRGRAALLGILGVGLGLRLLLLPTAPTLSHDLYRYLWDGRLAVAGVSPYRYPPSAPELRALRDEALYPRLSHREWRTIYPPGAQLLFAAATRLTPSSVLGLKLLFVAFDLLTLGLLLGWLRALGRPPAWALLYAWHPLVIVEIAGSGHLDAVALAATVAALWAATRGREGWAGALVGAGALVKLYPVLLLAAVAGRRPLRAGLACLGVIVGGYAVYAGDGLTAAGSLPRYLAEESFNGGLRTALEVALAPLGPGARLAARLVPLAALAAVTLAVALLARGVPVWRRALWVTGAYLVTTPNLFPWYALWIVPVAAVAAAWPWLYLTCAVGLAYVILAEPVWHLPPWVTALEWGPVALALVIGVLGRAGLRGRAIEGGEARPPDIQGGQAALRGV